MVPDSYADGPRLLADIGGTNARFALEHGPGRVGDAHTLACAEYEHVDDAVRAYLNRLPARRVRHAVIAIANPVDGDAVKMTNHHWAFSIAASRAALKLDTLLVVNDFAALAMALPALGPADLDKIGGGAAAGSGVIGLVGAGTGLGVAGLVPVDGRWVAVQSEGGHVAFSPFDEREVAVLQHCWQRYEHVSAERIVSGPGIVLIREALAAHRGLRVDASLSTADIVERGLAGSDPLCSETLDCFSGMLGTVAANLAVTLCARGGLYIGGGVVPRLGAYFARSPFRARFENKGRFSAFTSQIPTLVITASYPAMLGAAAILAGHLDGQAASAPKPRAVSAAPAPLPPPTLETENDHARF
ncbi:glucokinase [Massilia atriviolacea]|uniref:Glucokinase n=1 Tax=Massilia atriviolacea TaxID=2495579 RepID=A0A430HM56_9BURK|nr:glucokinase [Massilia atriviolacea]RSZ58559.1 glucokinase [Massilia atriviolacea]